MQIKFYNVEHGSCTHIITPKNQHFLIDIGSKTDKSLASHLKKRYLQNGRIDFLIITHPHEDHIYDLPTLYDLNITPRVLLRPKNAFDIVPSKKTEPHIRIAKIANLMNSTYSYPVDESQQPTNPIYNGGIEFDIIYPEDKWTTKEDINTFSNIIVIKYYNYKFIITGDNPKTILQKMMSENTRRIRDKISNATVLLAPHHGRTGEFCKEFFDCINPILTVISDKNIEHNTQSNSSQLYKGKGAKLHGIDRYTLTTRNEGTITFDISENNCIVSWSCDEY